MMSVAPYLPTNWEWVDLYEKKMGLTALVAYSRKLHSYFYHLPEGAMVEISDLVRYENLDLFTKCITRFMTEGSLKLQFYDNYSKIIKLR